MLFMSVTLEGVSPYRCVLPYERVRDETGREMHKSWGNAIDAQEALDFMGADVIRFLFCAQLPTQNINFGYGPGNEVKRRLLTLWNSVSFLVTYGNIDRFEPHLEDLESGPRGDLRPLDRWLLARTQDLVTEATAAYERFWTPAVTAAFERFVEDVSNWYIRRSRPRFWSGDDEMAFRVLWYALVQGLRVIAPVMPFLADELWRRLVAEATDGAPDSIFLAGWPEASDELADGRVLTEMEQVRRVVELARQARAQSGLKLRQPLRRLVVQGANGASPYADEIRDELRVKAIEFGDVDATELAVKPNLPVLGPRLGKDLPAVREALASGDFEELPGGGFRAAGHTLAPEDVLVERSGKEGWTVAAEDTLTVALDVSLDAELLREGRAFDLIHQINSMRKDAGLELTDRIVLTLPGSDADLVEHHGDWIKREVLATRINIADVDGPKFEKV